MVKQLLHLEGLVILLCSLYFYRSIGGNWGIFLLLLFTPDIFMLGYLKNSALGALIYNLGHTYGAPFTLFGIYLLTHSQTLLVLALILTAHISLDRLLGYGLKYPTRFQDTHLQKV